MERDEGELLEMTITGVQLGAVQDGYRPVTVNTSRGDVECRHYPADGTRKAAVWVGGIGGDYDTPARQLYPRLCQELTGEGIASLRVRFRHPTELEEAVLDVLAGITYLQGEGIDTLALVGHSFGGAVVIQAAALEEDAWTVVTLATQSHGTAPVSQLAPGCSILLIHGAADVRLPPSSSEYVYRLAHEPKKIILYPGAGHNLDEVAEEVRRAVHDWIVEKLSSARST